MLSGRGLCDESITRPEVSYRLWCVVVCDLEASLMRKPRGLSRQNQTNKALNLNVIEFKFGTKLRPLNGILFIDFFKLINIRRINPLNVELNPICHPLALLEAHHILHVSRISVNCR